jgi:hypothetical protein
VVRGRGGGVAASRGGDLVQVAMAWSRLGFRVCETKWSVTWFNCDESLTCRGLNSNPRYFVSFTFISVSFRESCLLVSWCAGGWCGMAGSDDDRGRSRRHGAKDRGCSHRFDTRWPGDKEVE